MKNKPAHILYAEDDPEDQEMFNELIEHINRPVEPFIFDNGLPLMQYLETLSDDQLPDCVVLDVNMPIWDGLRTLKAIRTEKRYSRVPVLMFTTSSEVLERKYCLQLGANDFLTKPMNQKEYETLAGQLSGYLGA